MPSVRHRNVWIADVEVETGGLYLVMFISSFSIVCAIVRLIALITYTKSPDVDWGLRVIPFISAMEAYVALITSSIPAIYPLLVRPKFNARSPNPQQQWRPDEEWLSNVKSLESRPETGASNGVSALGSGWTSAKDRAALGMDVVRKNRNSIYEIPFSTVSRNPSVVSSSSLCSKDVEAASTVVVER